MLENIAGDGGATLPISSVDSERLKEFLRFSLGLLGTLRLLEQGHSAGTKSKPQAACYPGKLLHVIGANISCVGHGDPRWLGTGCLVNVSQRTPRKHNFAAWRPARPAETAVPEERRRRHPGPPKLSSPVWEASGLFLATCRFASKSRLPAWPGGRWCSWPGIACPTQAASPTASPARVILKRRRKKLSPAASFTRAIKGHSHRKVLGSLPETVWCNVCVVYLKP